MPKLYTSLLKRALKEWVKQVQLCLKPWFRPLLKWGWFWMMLQWFLNCNQTAIQCLFNKQYVRVKQTSAVYFGRHQSWEAGSGLSYCYGHMCITQTQLESIISNYRGSDG